MNCDIVIVGGGIVGLSTALAIEKNAPGTRVCVLEKEATLGSHQTGNNSGVIHPGLYYKPGSAKAQTCVDGARRMVEFCKEHGIAHDICGKIVLATRESELPALTELLRRGIANGVLGIEEIGPDRIREIEPHAAGIKALWVPTTGIVDYVAVAKKYGELVAAKGGTVLTGVKVLSITRDSNGEQIVATNANEFRAKTIINCAGLHSDRVAKLSGAKPDAKIVPFRGQYYQLKPAAHRLVKGLIYPVPDPRFPFLGVHFTRMIAGGVEAGPNAVLALKREAYHDYAFDFRDAFDSLTYPGFWRMALKYWRTGIAETLRSFSKAAFVRSLQRLVPEIQSDDIESFGAGVRAQALLNDGTMVDDFRIVRDEHAIHVLNAPSPAATASLAIGERVAALLK